MDYCELNNIAIKDTHLYPHTDDILSSPHGSEWFFPLYLKSSYWQIPIQEDHKHKTASQTSFG